MITIKADRLQDGLYNIKNGQIFKYKEKGGTVRIYKMGEIVSCKECKWNYYEGDNIFCLRLSSGHYGHTIQSVEEDFFCKYGKRREE